MLDLFHYEGSAVPVTSQRHVAMLRNFCERELRRRWIDLSSVWFQQDGATAHTAKASVSVLREMFPQHISRGGDVPWPVRSPDLSACYYFLWGYLKSTVFISKPRERGHWGDQDVDGRIILRWIFRKLEGVVGTGWCWLRIGTSGGHLWVR